MDHDGIILDKEPFHMIAARPSIAEFRRDFETARRQEKAYKPTLHLSNPSGGSLIKRQVIVDELINATDKRLSFFGTIANGSRLERVHVSFSEAPLGYLEFMKD